MSSLLSKSPVYSGLVAVGFEWSALAIFYLLEPKYFDGQHPISYFATLDQTRYVFCFYYMMASVCLWVFFRYYLARYYLIPIKTVAVSLSTFLLLAILPYHPEISFSKYSHIVMFLVTSITFMYVMGYVSKQDHRIITKLIVVLSLISFVTYITLSKSNLTLVLESGWWLTLQLWIIVYSIKPSTVPNST